MNGEEIRRAREERGLTQAQLAAAIGVGARTVQSWEAGAVVPRNRMAILERFFADDEEDRGGGPPLRHASDADLIAEVARRFGRRF